MPGSNGTFVLGVDLGQRQDHTAIAVLETTRENEGWDPFYACPRWRNTHHVRQVERLPLNTPYTDIAERVHELACKLAYPWVGDKPAVVADATGVGAPVIDVLRRARLPGRLVPVLITSGDKQASDGRTYRVPKRDLISVVQLLLEHRRLTFSQNMLHGSELAKELSSMRVRVSAAGNEQFTPWRERDHDDLVLAVSLACWWASRFDDSLYA